MAGVRLRHGSGVQRYGVADQQTHTLWAPEKGRIEGELGGEGLVKDKELRIGSFLRAPGNGHLLEVPGEAAIKPDG